MLAPIGSGTFRTGQRERPTVIGRLVPVGNILQGCLAALVPAAYVVAPPQISDQLEMRLQNDRVEELDATVLLWIVQKEEGVV